MPCYNGDDNYDRGYNSAASDYRSEARRLKETVERFEAVLCGIMQLDPTIVDRINWKEVGITKQQHMNWWEEHQKADALRKEYEAAELREEKRRKAFRKQKAAAERVARKEKLRKELAKLEEQDARKAKKKVVKGKKEFAKLIAAATTKGKK